MCGVASVRRYASRSARHVLFVAFGLALLFTMGALVAFLIEMLLASRGLRDQANYATEVGETHELAVEGVGEPNSCRAGLGISTRDKNVCICAQERTGFRSERSMGSVTTTVARRGLAGKIADDDLVCPPPVSARDHPTRRLALCAFHAQLSGRRRSPCGAWSGYLLRNGPTMGIEVRAVVRPRTSASTPTANIALASR